MGLFQKVRDAFSPSRENQRSIAELYHVVQSMQTKQMHFFDPVKAGSLYSSQNLGLTDHTTLPRDLWDMYQKETYFGGLFDQILESLFKNEFYIDIATDEEGGAIGRDRVSKEIKEILVKNDYEQHVKKLVSGLYAYGGGNVLMFTIRDHGRMTLKTEAFLEEGQHRVKVWGDDANRVVKKYAVVDANGRAVYTLDPEKNYVKHIRYQDSGDYRFSIGPAKRAVYWYLLKNAVAGANLSSFRNGLQDDMFLSPDYAALTHLKNVMDQGKVSGNDTNEILSDPLRFLSRQSELDNAILKEIVGDARKTNSAVKLHMPYTVTKAGRTNREMETKELIRICDDQMAFALRTSKGIIDTRDSKYSNAEIEKDNFAGLVLDPLKRQVEKLTEEFIIPIFIPDYRADVYPVRFGRDPDAEDLEVYRARSDRNLSTAQVITTLLGTGYELDLETNEIVKAGDPPSESFEESDSEKSVGEAGERQKKKTRLTPAEVALKTNNAKRFEGIIRRTVKRQLDDYVKKIEGYDSVGQLRAGMSRDFPAASASGLPVSTMREQLEKFARVGVQEFQETEKSVTRMPIPDEIKKMIDAKAQLLLKGWNSLSPEQMSLIARGYGKSIEGYAGIDSTTLGQIETIVSDVMSQPDIDTGKTFIDDFGKEQPVMRSPGVREIVGRIRDESPKISLGRARRIAQTEVSQAVEATRLIQYQGAEYDEKQWVTVNDSKVRPAHRSFERLGWIAIDDIFDSTHGSAHSPADEEYCRCTLRFRRSTIQEKRK